MNLEQLTNECLEKIKKITQLKELEQIKHETIGKSGFISIAFQKMKNLSAEEKKDYGALINKCRNEINNALEEVQVKLEDIELKSKLNKEFVDVTIPSKPFNNGSIHPVSRALAEVTQIFGAMGFSVVSGPEIEDDFHNFTALNI